jgi:hypothetical protein
MHQQKHILIQIQIHIQQVHVSAIPYSNKFGGSGETDMDLSEYIDQVVEHRIVGGSHPWYVRIHIYIYVYICISHTIVYIFVCRYVFKGHPIPRESEKKDSLTKESICPTPPPLVEAFLKIPGSSSMI